MLGWVPSHASAKLHDIRNSVTELVAPRVRREAWQAGDGKLKKGQVKRRWKRGAISKEQERKQRREQQTRRRLRSKNDINDSSNNNNNDKDKQIITPRKREAKIKN